MKTIELLSPAGSMDSLRAAVGAGCDAAYIGGSMFGARAYADNPEEELLLRAIDYIPVLLRHTGTINFLPLPSLVSFEYLHGLAIGEILFESVESLRHLVQ